MNQKSTKTKLQMSGGGTRVSRLMKLTRLRIAAQDFIFHQ